MNGTGIEIHGTPKDGHKHEFHYKNHCSFSSSSECECGAWHIRYYSPDGHIGDSPNERIYELGCCYFIAGGYKDGFTTLSDCKDAVKIK